MEVQVGDLILVKMYNYARLVSQHQGLVGRYKGLFLLLKKARAKA